jgi:hypothetical protein
MHTLPDFRAAHDAQAWCDVVSLGSDFASIEGLALEHMIDFHRQDEAHRGAGQ